MVLVDGVVRPESTPSRNLARTTARPVFRTHAPAVVARLLALLTSSAVREPRLAKAPPSS